MPGCHGIDLLERVLRQHPDLPALVLTMHTDPSIARLALDARAQGYLTKDSSPDSLIDAVRHALARKNYVDPSLAALMVRDRRRSRASRPASGRSSLRW